MANHLEGKVALVTGGGSGIGRASALAFSREGARVVVADIDVSGGEQTISMIRDAGGDADFIKTNVTKAADVEALIDRIVTAWGRLDCALNNAGDIGQPALISESTEENWDHVIDTNLKGTWLCLRHEIRQMLKQGGGVIVNMTSVAGLAAVPAFSAYITSKHGLVGLTRAAALECAAAGIRVNAVCPGYVDTPMTGRVIGDSAVARAQVEAAHPLGRMAKPEEVAEATIWLCSDASSFVTGHILVLDGGYLLQ